MEKGKTTVPLLDMMINGIVWYAHCSRYYKEGSELTLDVGPFMKAMEVYTCYCVNLSTLRIV